MKQVTASINKRFEFVAFEYGDTRKVRFRDAIFMRMRVTAFQVIGNPKQWVTALIAAPEPGIDHISVTILRPNGPSPFWAWDHEPETLPPIGGPFEAKLLDYLFGEVLSVGELVEKLNQPTSGFDRLFVLEHIPLLIT